MMRSMRIWAPVAAAVALAGCNFNMTLPTSDPGLNAEADAMYRDLAAGKTDALLARMSAENNPEQVRSQIPMLRNLIGEATPPKPQVVQFQKTTSNAGQFYNVLQDYAYPDRVAHVSTNFKAEDGGWKVHGFNVNVTMTAPLTDPTPAPQSVAAPDPAPQA